VLYAFGFDRIGVVVSDLYFVNPDPEPGQEGPEQGVRLEVRLLERGELRGSIYSARPITVARPLWRADLLESVSRPGSLDRAHHHPRFSGWEPGRRHFVEEMTADPVAWLAGRLSDLGPVLEAAGASEDVGPSEVEEVQRAAPQIVEAVRRLLDGVRAGQLAQPPEAASPESARLSWL
jgi:hypothetical protein